LRARGVFHTYILYIQDPATVDARDRDQRLEVVPETETNAPVAAGTALQLPPEEEHVDGGTHAVVEDGQLVRRTRRAVRVTARMAEARRELGLDGDVDVEHPAQPMEE